MADSLWPGDVRGGFSYFKSVWREGAEPLRQSRAEKNEAPGVEKEGRPGNLWDGLWQWWG